MLCQIAGFKMHGFEAVFDKQLHLIGIMTVSYTHLTLPTNREV